MSVQSTDVCEYRLNYNNESLLLNDWIGKQISINFSGDIFCQECQVKIRKSYSQGYCYVHSQALARCDLCILKPELCHYHKGTCREPQWGLDHCMQPHIVYLSNTTGLKVGITRLQNMPSRWIDQGACQALPLFEVDSRLHSGLVEITFAKFIADKTNWRALIKSDADLIDLTQRAKELIDETRSDLEHLKKTSGFSVKHLDINNVKHFKYPVESYPEKAKSLSLDKMPNIEGQLLGIKGQYLLLDTGAFNVRKHTGYQVSLGYK